ncbi:septal ring lytic transglycosylase RlpA family protein [Lysobacter fragariae]
MLALAACAGVPKKSPPPPTASVGKGEDRPATASSKKQSPYAAAQEDPGTRGHYVAGGLYAPHVADSVPDDIPDVDSIPEPEVTDEPRSSVGNRKSYAVLGKKYQVLDSAQGYVETGVASFYGKKFHGRRTSNLEVYDMYAFTAAHKTLPLPSFARVTNLDNGKSVVVRVNDRGPFHAGRIIDLSYAAATKLGYVKNGTARVEVRALTSGEDKPEYAGAANNPPPSKDGTRDRKPAKADAAIATRKPADDSAMDKLLAAMPIATASAAETTSTSGLASAMPASRSAPSAADYRFDMRKDGRTMTANEFETWMKSRQVRVATGKPGTPQATAVPSAPVAGSSGPASVAAAAPPPPAPVQAAAAVASTVQGEDRVTLQVAAFSARDNADRALRMLQGAGIDAARLLDGSANGQKVWRLRVGPLAATTAPELAARIVGLGFGQPQRVRE